MHILNEHVKSGSQFDTFVYENGILTFEKKPHHIH